MKFIKIIWEHDYEDEPITILIEIDDNRMENKRIEIYKDGNSKFASKPDHLDLNRLSESPFPPVEKFNALNDKVEDSWKEEVRASEISCHEFYAHWKPNRS